jgi:hypothetical protein
MGGLLPMGMGSSFNIPADIIGYMERGVDTPAAIVAGTANNLPFVGSYISVMEMIDGRSMQPNASFGRDLSGGDYAFRGLRVSVDVLSLGYLGVRGLRAPTPARAPLPRANPAQVVVQGSGPVNPAQVVVQGPGTVAPGQVIVQPAAVATVGAPTLPAFSTGTQGVLRIAAGDIPLQSAVAGPARYISGGPGSGFDILTRTHVEGHTAALMRQWGLSEATVYINNPVICENCMNNLPRMLPSGGRLTIVTPDGAAITVTGGSNNVSAVLPGGTTVNWTVRPLPGK